MNLFRIILKNNFKKNITICGSKSLSNRYLICSFLCKRNFILIYNLSNSEDTKITINFLLKNNVKVIKNKKKVIIYNNFSKIYNSFFFLKNAGTAVRSLLSVISFLTKKPVVIDGNENMRKRPIHDLIKNLKLFGCKIEFLKNDFHLPVLIKKAFIKKKKKVCVNCKFSSQYASSLILCLSYLFRNFVFFLINLNSDFYIRLTIKVLEDFNISVKKKGEKYVKSRKFKFSKTFVEIETDLSSSGYFFFNSFIKSGFFLIKGIKLNSTQGEIKILNVFKILGLKYIFNKIGVFYFCLRKKLNKNITVNCKDIPDSSLILTNLFLLGFKRIKLFNIKNWNYKETNRIYALFLEHKKIGSLVKKSKNWLIIKRYKIRNNVFIRTYNDHRISMVFSSFCFFINKIYFFFPRSVKKTFQNYYLNFNFLLALKNV